MTEKTENKTQFQQVREFHHGFNCPAPEEPEKLSDKLAVNRAAFIMEEVIELLHATAGNDERFATFYEDLMTRAAESYRKQLQKSYPDDQLIGQMDAFTDILYFANGGFVEAGVEPEPIFDIVHAANMGKIFPDGKPHYNEVGKVIKPDNWEHDHAPEPKIQAEINRQIELGGKRFE
jgi:predicted HAD superfamily Cof-like phosphohydrolase